MQTLQTWSFILLLGVWISHETISCCVVFNILHGEKICAVLGKNMANKKIPTDFNKDRIG